jgi:hypothetical protein
MITAARSMNASWMSPPIPQPMRKRPNQSRRSAAGPSHPAPHRRHRLQQRHQQSDLVAVAAGQRQRERDAMPLGQHVVPGARPATIDRTRPGSWAALEGPARASCQSPPWTNPNCPASCNSSNSSRSNRSHTPRLTPGGQPPPAPHPRPQPQLLGQELPTRSRCAAQTKMPPSTSRSSNRSRPGGVCGARPSTTAPRPAPTDCRARSMEVVRVQDVAPRTSTLFASFYGAR